MDFNTTLTVMIYAVIVISFLGLREVAVALSDPFGDDDVDFDVEGMLAAAHKNSVALLQDERPAAGTDLEELNNPVLSGPAAPNGGASKTFRSYFSLV